MKILIPTDFSSEASHALKYALNYSSKLDAEFILLHVDSTTKRSHTLSNKLYEAIEEVNLEELNTLANSVKKEMGLDVKIDIVELHGAPVTRITTYAKINNIDLIVMGSKGEGGILSKIFGSVASGVMENAGCPVLLVPGSAEIKTPTEMVYASDLTNIEEEISHIIPFAKRFDATIHTVHVYPEAIDGSSFDEERVLLSEIAESKYQKLNFNAVMDFDIIRGLNRYVQEVNTDLLAMYTHKSSILEFLFNDSYSKEMGLHNDVPLLVMAKTMDADIAVD